MMIDTVHQYLWREYYSWFWHLFVQKLLVIRTFIYIQKLRQLRYLIRLTIRPSDSMDVKAFYKVVFYEAPSAGKSGYDRSTSLQFFS